MFRRLFFSFFFSLYFFSLIAQQSGNSSFLSFPMYNIHDYNHSVYTYIQYNVNSNAITNSFINGAFGKGLITEQEKQDVINKLKPSNRLGYQLDFGMKYKTNSLFKRMTFIAGWEYKDFFHAGFNQYVFELLFKGNKHLAGKNAILTPFNFTYFGYEKIFGGIETWVSEKRYRVGGTLSLIKGSDFQSGEIKNGSFYTSSSGDSLHINTRSVLKLNQSTTNQRLKNFSGYGAAVDIYFSFHPDNPRDGYFLEIMDIGMIHWNNVESITIDDENSFTGKDIDNLFSTTDTLVSDFEIDSLENILETRVHDDKVNYMLPGVFHVFYRKQVYPWLTFIGGAKAIVQANYCPRVYLAPVFEIPYEIAIRPLFSYGGYGMLDVGIHASKVFYDRYFVGITSYYLENIVSPATTTGQGIGFYGRVLF